MGSPPVFFIHNRRGFGPEDCDTGWFRFVDDPVLAVRVFDGCAFNNHHWTFYAATTDVEYTITITDTATDRVREYRDSAGHPFDAVVDTEAFATCP
jgi:hypothetical protein